MGLAVLPGFDFRGAIVLTIDFANLLILLYLLLFLGPWCSGPRSRSYFLVVSAFFFCLWGVGIWFGY